MALFTDLTDEQLVHKVLQVERDLVTARFKHSMNQLENTARLRVLRRDIARLQTEAHQATPQVRHLLAELPVGGGLAPRDHRDGVVGVGVDDRGQVHDPSVHHIDARRRLSEGPPGSRHGRIVPIT